MLHFDWLINNIDCFKISGIKYFMISKIVTVWDFFMENLVQETGGQSIEEFINFYS